MCSSYWFYCLKISVSFTPLAPPELNFPVIIFCPKSTVLISLPSIAHPAYRGEVSNSNPWRTQRSVHLTKNVTRFSPPSKFCGLLNVASLITFHLELISLYLDAFNSSVYHAWCSMKTIWKHASPSYFMSGLVKQINFIFSCSSRGASSMDTLFVPDGGDRMNCKSLLSKLCTTLFQCYEIPEKQ